MSSRYPIPPGVVGKIIKAAADPATSVSDLARLLETDAVLSSLVLKSVNSASFGLRHKIAAVDRAVAFMGIRSIRNLVLSLGIKDLVPAREIGGFPVDTFWLSSLRRAASARCLAKQLQLPEAEEFFTMGLCQDLGILMRLRDDPKLASLLADSLHQPSDVRLGLETALGEGHDKIGHRLFTEWRFPEELTLPVRYHHDPEQAPQPQRISARVAHAAEALADLGVVANKPAAAVEASRRLLTLGLSDDQVGTIFEQIDQTMKEFAELLGLELEAQPSFEEIVTLASRGLAELNLSYEDLTRRLQEALAEQQRVASQLSRLNDDLGKQARHDELTGLPNRRAFDETLVRELAVANRQKATLTLLMIDIDHFKIVNDTHGHQAGDYVLRAVGQVLIEQARLSDLAARYGGEEFAVILPFTDARGAAIAAERMLESVRRLELSWKGQPIPVTVSCGGASIQVQTPDGPTATEIVRLADEALYRAKRATRDCYRANAPVAVSA